MSVPAEQPRVPDLDIAEFAAGWRDGLWSAREVTAAVLERISRTDPTIRAWILVDASGALEAAERADRELTSGVDRGPLQGVPIGVKDIIDVAGWPTRCGSAARRDVRPARSDARVVGRLRDAGAVILGKTVTQEFAAGVVSTPARNPWDPERIPGGSSGGSAAAVACGNCFGALGSDTGGSIRIPAAACGVVGFKPTYGDIETEGVYPLSWSLDTVGPLTRGVVDAWIMWQELLGAHLRQASPRQGWPAEAVHGMRIGVLREGPFTSLQPDVKRRADQAITALRELGVTIVDIDWPLASAARAAAFVINRVETSATHTATAEQRPSQFQLYGDELRLRIAAGRAIPATLYLEAKRVRGRVHQSMRDLFAKHRLAALAAPTLPTTAVAASDLSIVGTGVDESLSAAWTRLTMPFNATGQPVLSVPVGLDSDGLPVGMQLAGEPGREVELFRIGRALELTLGTRSERPPLLRSDASESQMTESNDHGS